MTDRELIQIRTQCLEPFGDDLSKANRSALFAYATALEKRVETLESEIDCLEDTVLDLETALAERES